MVVSILGGHSDRRLGRGGRGLENRSYVGIAGIAVGGGGGGRNDRPTICSTVRGFDARHGGQDAVVVADHDRGNHRQVVQEGEVSNILCG